MNGGSPKKKNFSPIRFNPLTNEEESFLQLALEEYDDLFPNIMTFSQAEFIPILEKFIQIALSPKGIGYPLGTISKILKIIQYKYYEPEYAHVNKLIQSIDDINNCEKFVTNNYIPHCNHTTMPIHKCGDKLYILGSYLLCLKCKMIYRSSCVLFHCDYCEKDYYTSIEKDNNIKYKPATWEKYHCNAVINDVMKCFKCKNCLYINVYNLKLCCLKCNFEIEQNRIKWKCIICNEDFQSDAKVYNPLEFKNMKIAVKQAIYEGIKAKPDVVPCCDMTKEEIEKANFYHKKDCNGILYQGILDNNKIIVCSKCHKLYYFEHHFWTCPICKERFRLSSSSGNNKNSVLQRNSRYNQSPEKEKRKYHQERTLSQLLRYNTPNYKKENNEYNNSSSNKDNDSNEMKKSNTRYGRMRGISTSGVRINRNKTDVNGVSGFKLNVDNITAEDKVYPKSPNKNRRGMNINNIKSDLGNKLYNINVNVNIDYNSNQPGNIRKIPLPYNIKKDSNNICSNSSTNNKTKTNNSTSSNNSNIDDSNNIKPIISTTANSFNSDDFTIIKQIGEGTFGKIYAVEDSSKKPFAMKKILAGSSKEITSLKNELDMLISLSKYQLNLVTIYGIETKQLDKTTYVMYVLMDLAVRDWEKEIEFRKTKKNYYTEEELIVILKELAYTFAELQKLKISHRDIKPQNILLFPDKTFRIADFGEAKEVLRNSQNTVKQTIRGTELYMSPILFHALNNKGVNLKYTEHNTFKSDVFSLGLCFLLAATLTFNSLVDIRELTDMTSLKMVVGRYLKPRYSNAFIDVIDRMLEINEKDRCDFIELNKIVDNL